MHSRLPHIKLLAVFGEHFEQETFKSDVACNAEVVSTTKRLVWIHKRLFNVDDS